MQLTISGAVSQQNKTELRVHGDVSLSLPYGTDPAAIRQRHFILASQTSENGDNMFWGFVRFIDEHYTPVGDGTKKRRICMFNYTMF